MQNFIQHYFPGLLFPVILLFAFCDYAQENPSTIELSDNWFIYPSEKLNVKESIVSSQGYSTIGWYKTEIPKTVLAALVENGIYKDPYYGMNLSKIAKSDFEHPWWYRKEFEIDNNIKGNYYQLIFEGINYKADLWVNGKKIASKDEFEGSFGMFTFNITSVVLKGTNVIAVKIYPPVKGDLTLGFVDWNPDSPDQNMGI